MAAIASGFSPCAIGAIIGSMPIDPDNDPNEAYEVVPMKPEPHGPPADWWTLTCNGISAQTTRRRAGRSEFFPARVRG